VFLAHPVLRSVLYICNSWTELSSTGIVIYSYEKDKYEGVSKSFRTGCLERELQMVQLSATKCSCITILWVSLVNFAAITLYVASQRVFTVVSVYFVINLIRKLLDTPSYYNQPIRVFEDPYGCKLAHVENACSMTRRDIKWLFAILCIVLCFLIKWMIESCFKGKPASDENLFLNKQFSSDILYSILILIWYVQQTFISSIKYSLNM
jgi:hypothetical protein